MANTNYDRSIDATKGPKEYNTVLPFLLSGAASPFLPSFLPAQSLSYIPSTPLRRLGGNMEASGQAVLDPQMNEKLLQCNVRLTTACSSIVWFHSNPASMAPGSLYVVAGAAGGICGCCGAGGGATRALGMSIRCSLMYSFNSNVRF